MEVVKLDLNKKVNSDRLVVMLPNSLKKKIKGVAEANSLSVSEYVRKVLEAQVEEKR